MISAQASRICRRCLATGASPVTRARSPTLLFPRIQIIQRRWASKDGKKIKSMTDINRRWSGTGPFSVAGIVIFIFTGIGLWFYFENEKERINRKRQAEENKTIGKPQVGGPFELIDHHGHIFSSEDLKGRFSLVYFGFTRCPDICPDELDKMARMIDLVSESTPAPAADPYAGLVPVFVTCDPARDTPAALKTYLAEFHEKLVGLTGPYEDIKAICKAYRVYFSTPEKVAPGKDYLVDHSIYFYLMDPEGNFVEALGRQHSPEEGAKLILSHMRDWKGEWRTTTRANVEKK